MRRESDFYPTPEWVTRALFRKHPLAGVNVLEPCAGDGAIVRVIKEHRPMAHVTAVEIRKEEMYNLVKSGTRATCADFLAQPLNWFSEVDTIITNPPFSLAQEIAERCFEIAGDRAEVWLLLRLAFLESRRRCGFWQKHPVNRLYVLAERPSFTGDNDTDRTAYAWFGWLPGCDNQRIEVLSREG